jgi:hypothetical protein
VSKGGTLGFPLTLPLPPVLAEICERPVPGPFPGRGEEAAGDFVIFPMILDALAAITSLVAGGVRAGTVVDSAWRDAFHGLVLSSGGVVRD